MSNKKVNNKEVNNKEVSNKEVSNKEVSNKKMKKVLIPVLAVAVLAGGGFTIANAQGQAALAKQAKITQDEAINAALEKVPGTVEEVELEDEKGTIVYEIELVSTDGTEHEVEVDAQTGEVLKVEADDDDDGENEEEDSQNQAKLAKQAKITEDEAINMALEKVPGTVNEIELEVENGTVVYEIEVLSTDGTEQEVKVDAQTGEVLKVEADDDENEE